MIRRVLLVLYSNIKYNSNNSNNNTDYICICGRMGRPFIRRFNSYNILSLSCWLSWRHWLSLDSWFSQWDTVWIFSPVGVGGIRLQWCHWFCRKEQRRFVVQWQDRIKSKLKNNHCMIRLYLNVYMRMGKWEAQWPMTCLCFREIIGW